MEITLTTPPPRLADEPTDQDLVARVLAAREETAFRLLYRRHTPMLRRVAIRLAGGQADQADDLVHDVWIRAVERLGVFEWRSRLSTWLTAILFNRVREARRDRAASTLALEDVDEPAAIDAPIDDRLDLESALARLPDGYRAVVTLHDIEGFTHEEVAKLMGIEIGTSKSQLSRARRALRHWLEPGLKRR